MRRAWRRFRGWPTWVQVLVAVVVVLVVIGAASGGSGSKTPSSGSASSSSDSALESAPETTTEAAPEPKADIRVVASKTFCATTGIDDAYTGDGHVEFFMTFRNTGDADGSVDVVPVRHYDDGEINESALDMFSVDVAAGSVQRLHSDKMVYKAHEHEITDCGLTLDGGDEVPIKVVALG